MEAPLTKTLDYHDANSSVAIWWKAIFMMPVWGAAAIPVLGTLALVFINDKSLDFFKSPGWQMCLSLTMVSCMVYFMHDLRKRTIFFRNDEIKFGLRTYPLGSLVSVGVEYNSQQMMPKRIVLRFRDGKILKLKVSRLRYNQFETILHFVETRLPHVHIDPVMLTLMRCRRAAGKAISDTGDSVEIRYESRFAIKELIDVFRKTFDEWSVFGPVLLSIATVPIWTSTIAMFFMLPTYMMRVTDNNVALLKILSELWEQAYRYLGEVADKGGHHVADVAGSPLVVIAVTVVAMAMVYGLLKTVLRPNRIIVQADSINLTFRLGARLYTRKIAIETITKISLHKPSDMADPSKWFIRIELNNKKPVDLSIAALNSEERTKLTKSIQRLAPQIPIDSALLETLIPRQDRSYTELWLQSLSTAPERKSMEPLQPGQMLSSLRYLVIRCLGVGGQGTAYLCKDTGLVESHLSDMVVLKESIFPVYADSTVRMQALERFEKEASLLRRLEHPGIVGLRDYFLEDHRGYLVMEHAEGKTLKQLVEEEGVLSEMRVRELALQMCDTLAYLHANGVVHRDFTPDNLILSKSGQLKVIDFNVAQQMEAGSAGTIVGKQSYLPPEQFRGKASTQSDIYAMGATLQFLLTGEDPEPISQSSPLESGAACSATLDQIVRNCTALQTQKRIGSAEELKEQLLAGRSAPEETTVIKTAKELEPHELSLNGDSDSEASIKLNLAKQEDLLEMENK